MLNEYKMNIYTSNVRKLMWNLLPEPELLKKVADTVTEWRSHAPSGRIHGTYEIEKYELVSIERK